MKISQNYYCQSFRGESSDKKPITSITSAIDAAAKKTGDIADLVTAAKTAMDTPEEATVRVLNKKLETVVNNNDLPNWAQKAAKYTSAALITGLYFFGIKKAFKVPGMIKDFSTKQLMKFDAGKSILNMVGSVKGSAKKVAEIFQIKPEMINNIKDNVMKHITPVTDFLKSKTPKALINLFTGIKEFLKQNNWTKGSIIKNGLAACFSLAEGKAYLDKNTDAKETEKAEVVNDENIPEIKEAA